MKPGCEITAPMLHVDDLHIFYRSAHVIQGVTLTLNRGTLSIVGRNGMGKTTLCKAIMGLIPARIGSINFCGRQICGQPPHIIAMLGVGYVPQGRRLWPSLSVDEHLTLVAKKGSYWTAEGVYQIFPSLAKRRNHRSGQLSGGEQQMLAIGRSLLCNPKLLIMDEPTEGLAPVIVRQIERMITDIVADSGMSVLIIEQNIGVATRVSDMTAVMVGGRISCVMPSAELASDRQLQQHLLGVSRRKEDDGEPTKQPASS